MLRELRNEFEKNNNVYEQARLTFLGVDGYDVYNCSIPFVHGGRSYIYGRVEKPEEWARSRVMLFENTGKDLWTRVNNSMIYQLEDPNIAFVEGKLVLGGVFVFYSKGQGVNIQNMFYRGTDLEDMYFFTIGPLGMKDIRLVQMPKGKIGVFSRPRTKEVFDKFGCYSAIGFTTISSLDELSADVIDNAAYIPDLFGSEEWGGVNQAYYLESGRIGMIGHKCYNTLVAGEEKSTYLTMSFVFDTEKNRVIEEKIIATRNSFPAYRSKKSHIVDCTFPSGIVMREDGKCDLYSGLSDCAEGRVIIDYPFEGYGKIITY